MAKALAQARRSIFSAARELLDARGYAALNMREVAGRSGVALGTIYNYYENKNALVRDMMLVQWVAFTERQAAVAALPHSVYVRLFRLYQEFRRFADMFSGVWDDAEQGGPGETYAERLAACVEAMLAEEARRGAIRPSLGLRDTARYISVSFIAMCRVPGYHYELFEAVVKEIL